MRRALLPALLVLALPAPAARADGGDVIVRYASGTDAGERVDSRQDADVRFQEALPAMAGGTRAEVVDPEPGVSAAEAVRALNDDPDVLYAEPDVRRHVLAAVNDPYFGAEWALQNTGQVVGGESGAPGADIAAPEAWDVTTGSPSVLVGVVDSGVDLTHPDLRAGLVQGYDFVEGDSTPQDGNGHGTHVAGTIGARGGDGIGVAGVAYSTSLLPLRVLDAEGGGPASAAIQAYGYARRAGAKVVNLSLGGSEGSRTERDAIAAASGTLFVAAAGNDGADDDAVGSYPCEYELPNVICVAASDRQDALATFSNYGRQSVDLAAPGTAIASTWTGGRYALLDGTSMATPHVAGVAALLFAAKPDASVAEVREALLRSVDKTAGLTGRVATDGRLDAAAALAFLRGGSAAVAAEQQDQASQPAREPAAEPSSSSSSSSSASPTGASSATPAQPPDRRAPLLVVTSSPSKDLRALVRRGLRTTVRCSEGCALRVDLRADAATRRALGLRSVLVRRGRTSRASSGSVAITLRLPAAAAGRAARRSVVRLTLQVVARDAAGNVRTVARRLTLRR